MNRPQQLLCLLLAVAATQVRQPAQAADAPKGERYALLVGVHKYSEAKELRPLPYAENDVTELAAVLRDGGYKAENVVLLTQTAGADEVRFFPMKARVLMELRLLLANRSEDDTVLLAFAGHGVIFKEDPVSYFCPADAQLDDKETLLSLTDVYRELEGCKAGTKVLLVDACRNDPLKDGTRAPARLKMDSVTRPPEPAKDGGVAALFSCSRGQKAYEDEKSKHGAFFHFVIEGLKGEASAGHDEVTLLELGAYVQRRVADFTRSEYGADQKPEMTNASTEGAATLWHAADYLQAYRKGKKFLAQEDYEKAVDEFTEAIRLNPRYALAFKDRGNIWLDKGKNDKAMADYNEAIRLDPKFAAAFNNRALIWEDKKDYDKGLADFDEAIRLDPKLAKALRNRGELWMKKKEYDKAMADYDEAIRLDPKNANFFKGRGDTWMKKVFDKVIADFAEVARLDPNNTNISKIFDDIYKKQDYGKALADYDEAIRLDPKNAESFRRRGDIWRYKQEYDKALADYDEAIRLDPKNAYFFYWRGSIWRAKGELEKADADYETAKRLEMKEPINSIKRMIYVSTPSPL